MIDLHVIEVWSEAKADWFPTGNVGTLKECRRTLRRLNEWRSSKRRRIARYVRTAGLE